MSSFKGVTIETPVLNPSWLWIREYDGEGQTHRILVSGLGDLIGLRDALTREIRRRKRAGQ